MGTKTAQDAKWQLTYVASPLLGNPVPVVAARDIPYLPNANRLQTLSIYLPWTPETSSLIGTPVSALPESSDHSPLPLYYVHIHGGAWRAVGVTAASIEPAVAQAFSATGAPAPAAVASINYTLSPFPTDSVFPYETIRDNHGDPARDAVHPQHISDVLRGLDLLRSFGLTDQSYILSGHSCGACLAFQAALQPPRHYGLDRPDVPCPAAVLGLNGLYDLPALTDGLGASHEHVRDDYDRMLTSAFGADKRRWPEASPARFDPAIIGGRVREGKSPRLVVLDQSTEDELVPMNQKARLESTLGKVNGLQVAEGHRCTGKHAAPWQRGDMIWESLQDIFALLPDGIDGLKP